MKQYIFILGTASQLALAELTAVFSRLGYSFTSLSSLEKGVLLTTEHVFDTNQLIKTLGGTIKIAQVLSEVPDFSANTLVSLVKPFMGEKNAFGLSFYGSGSISIPKLSIELKELLGQKGLSARYILPKEGQTLGSAVVKKQPMHEFILFSDSKLNQKFVAQTMAIQDIDDWSKRDFSRPFADSHAGMLPPKVARMMVNLAMSNIKSQMSKSVVMDPFCGMGTVLAEALLLGNEVLGSDIIAEAVKKTEGNIEWLKKEYPATQDLSAKFLVADAVHLSEYLPEGQVDAIVTEPFLGGPFEKKGTIIYQKKKALTVQSLKNILKGLEKLYIGAFREWSMLLKPEGKVVIVLPAIEFAGEMYTVKKLIDNCEKLGYTTLEGPYMYARPQAVVKRQIYVFKKEETQNPNI